MTALDGPHAPTPEEIADLFTPVEAAQAFADGQPIRLIDMWPVPDPDAEHARRRAAVTAVLGEFEPSMVVTVEMADELIAAATTGV